MILNVAAIYQTDADEVSVDFRSTENDNVTTTVADKLKVTLYSQSKNLVGAISKHPLAVIDVTPAYLQSEQNYTLKFRHPKIKVDLIVDVDALYGVTNYTKSVTVGEDNSTQATMSLPDNVLYEKDYFDFPENQGPTEIPNDNIVVLAKPIQEYVKLYDFTLPRPVEDYEPLTYVGGGNRLLMSNQTNGFLLQQANFSPWGNKAYAFMEAAATNLLPNSFFNNGTSGTPNGYQVDAAGAMVVSTLDTDYQTATGAKIWSLRLRQNNSVSAFNEAVVFNTAPVAVTNGATYTGSAYFKIQAMSPLTKITKFAIGVRWYTGSAQIGEDVIDLDPADFKALSLASFSGMAPGGANFAQLILKVGSIDFGDDVLLQTLAPQLESGILATSRTQGVRAADKITIPTYDASNQKIRMELIPGFDAGHSFYLTSGPIVLSFTASSTLRVDIPVCASFVEAPVAFSSGDLVDFTVEHVAGSLVKIYLSGNLVAQSVLPAFTATPAPLEIVGAGFELLKLSVFSRM